MKLVLLTIAWSLLEVTKAENCDGSHMSLPNLELRVSSNTDTCQYSGKNCITDANLASGWYDVGSRNMPTDPSGLRTYSSCGTHWPIWLNEFLLSFRGATIVDPAFHSFCFELL